MYVAARWPFLLYPKGCFSFQRIMSREGAYVVIHLGRSKYRIEVLWLVYCTSVTGRPATTLIPGLLLNYRSSFSRSRGIQVFE